MQAYLSVAPLRLSISMANARYGHTTTMAAQDLQHTLADLRERHVQVSRFLVRESTT